MSLAIEAVGLARSFGDVRALQGVDLAVPVGGSHAYVGVNGAGKTTTLSILATLLEPTSGTARVMGHDVVGQSEKVRGLVGFVSDEGVACCPDWTPFEYLDYFATMGGRGDPEATLDMVGLPRADWRKPKRALSTGMLRRVEIARALLTRPRVLLLDEPTRGLDLPRRNAMWALLRAINEKHGTTLLVSSHDVAEIQELCQTLTVLSRGRVTYQGDLRTLPRDPRALERLFVERLTTNFEVVPRVA